MIGSAMKSAFEMFGYQVTRIPSPRGPQVYIEDALTSEHCHDFDQDPRFVKAYEVARQAMRGAYHAMRWRAHVMTWCGTQCTRLPGDFVECGVSHGFMSSLLMSYLDWDRHNKTFFLLDTFAGIDLRYTN